MKFNKLLKNRNSRKTLNLAGGEAFQASEKLELVSLLLTSFLDDQFYRTGNQAADRLRALVRGQADSEFVAKAALYARHEAGMRSVSHLVAGELAKKVKGADWTKRFFERVVLRTDDVLEILSYYVAVHGKPLPNAMKKGLAQALAQFDAYQLAKYRRDTASLKLVDAVNLLHPKHTEALGQLVRGDLAPAATWETKLTQAGQNATSDVDKAVRKANAWEDLVRSRKIGYFALLRNLRNILEQAPKLTDDVIKMLVNQTSIQRSLVLPFRFRTAVDAVSATTLSGRHRVIKALSKAADHSLANVPRFEGHTLIAMDCSGSMIGRPMKIGSLFAAALYKTSSADLMLFSGDAKFVSFDKSDATLSIASRIEDKAEWSGTNFHAIFDRAKIRYDRVIILSDMQGWMGNHAPTKTFEAYKRRTGARPKVFSLDLNGYGHLTFPERDVHCLAGFSDKTLETLRFLESDKQALLGEIERVEI